MHDIGSLDVIIRKCKRDVDGCAGVLLEQLCSKVEGDSDVRIGLVFGEGFAESARRLFGTRSALRFNQQPLAGLDADGFDVNAMLKGRKLTDDFVPILG